MQKTENLWLTCRKLIKIKIIVNENLLPLAIVKKINIQMIMTITMTRYSVAPLNKIK